MTPLRTMHALALIALACGGGDQKLSAQTIRQFRTDSAWRYVWGVGPGTNSNKLSDEFIEPRGLAVTNGMLFVLDLGTRELHGIEALTGAPRYKKKALGVGPGEFKRPIRITTNGTGVAVFDQETGRLTGYSSTLSTQWDINIPDPFGVDGFCVDGNRILTKYERADSSIVVFDTSGTRLGTLRIPWRTASKSTLEFAHTSYVSSVSPDGSCAIAPVFGAEWAVVNARTGIARAYKYAEPGENAVITIKERILDRSLTKVLKQEFHQTETRNIAMSVTTRGDTTIIQAGSTVQTPLRILDFYNTSTGRYLFSRRLPVTFNTVAMGPSGVLYGASLRTDGGATIVASRPEAWPTSSPPSGARAASPARRPPPAPARDPETPPTARRKP